jgi:hypothetical protein
MLDKGNFTCVQKSGAGHETSLKINKDDASENVGMPPR